jgi:hypothetical protein
MCVTLVSKFPDTDKSLDQMTQTPHTPAKREGTIQLSLEVGKRTI